MFWIGGSTCAGKSTTADVLAQKHEIPVYHFDRREPFHIHRSIPEEQPRLIAFMGRTMDERWVLRSPEEMATEVMACWAERFPMVVSELEEMVDDSPVIAEGVGLFPSLVEPFLANPSHAGWLIATPQFQEWVRRTRGKTVADAPHISDRERAYRNLVARDVLIAAQVREQAENLGLRVLQVDAAMVANTVDHLEPNVLEWLQCLTSA